MPARLCPATGRVTTVAASAGICVWRPIASATVKPVNAVTLRGSASFPLTLYAVTVSVGWRDGGVAREVRLDTEQIGQGTR